ncbi:hypothetical protein IMG5_196080 [Ichthyophthirius multifiliis]|uniref:EF-hand domain-containing protein n=1 Tax=Ichthyophthirius multifiliis TaxID=5932 RepID=G0R524_ICHMU|nr:hypothetical protein IMG5_196080 [Ichthyophthirius multifiliis]EGR27426.1 hypothetical protein IMG5_196080 [Ichthyophthirius multifiliis]|eukprot:XP_004024336.1 hypothetical protein IMG5_196080 [Ichthyophthirius multifiliis]
MNLDFKLQIVYLIKLINIIKELLPLKKFKNSLIQELIRMQKQQKNNEDEIYKDFFNALDLYNMLNVQYFFKKYQLIYMIFFQTQQNQNLNERISKQQFFDFFNNLSASISDDHFFEIILVNTFSLQQQNSYLQNNYAGHKNMFDPNKKGFLQDHHRSLTNGGTVSSNAPFGTSQEPTEYSTQLRPYNVQTQSRQSPYKQKSLYQQHSSISQKTGIQLEATPISQLRNKLSQRGIRGFIKLYSNLKNAQYKNKITLNIFQQCLQEQRIQLQDTEFIFNKYYNYQQFDIQIFFKDLKGKIKDSRQALIVYAFQQIDTKRCGEVYYNDIICNNQLQYINKLIYIYLFLLKENYNYYKHPFVQMGQITEDEALFDFTDSFEFLMAVFNQSNLNKQRVHFNEFYEYYHILSTTIDDDQLFENIMTNCWNIQNTYKR